MKICIVFFFFQKFTSYLFYKELQEEKTIAGS